MGIRKKPEYVWKEYRENGVEKCSMAVYLGESQSHPNHPPFQVNFTGHRFSDTCQSVARKPLNSYAKTTAERSLKPPSLFPTQQQNTPTWRKRLQALSGRDPTEDDPTIVYMAGYLHTLDTHYDDLSSHCTHLNSRVESLEQQVKELKKEKASLQECLDIAEGEEANTREAYRTLKMDYDKKLKKLAPKKKI
jgi:outer membrane murein-binding lipoprotein Lpp